ncbi:hypothetical protein GCM10023148_40270 [Actinokineospora soli]
MIRGFVSATYAPNTCRLVGAAGASVGTGVTDGISLLKVWWSPDPETQVTGVARGLRPAPRG